MKRRRAAAGFTLIEVMIVIVILGALIGIVAVNVLGSRDEAKIGICKIDLQNLQNAMDQFNLTYDRYPTEDEGIEVLWSSASLDVEDETAEEQWRAFLKKPKPNDVWGSPWGYRAESEYDAPYDLWSNGPDKEEGTDDDIVSWFEDEDGEFDTGASSGSE